MKIIIKDVPPSNNTYMGNGSRGKNYKYQNDKKKWAKLVLVATMDKVPLRPIKKSIVTLTYYFKTRHRRDPDNYSGKFLLDGLVLAKIIEDDSFNSIDLRINGNYDKENPRTEITIEEVDEIDNGQ